jgi:hypothetical protein
MKNWLDKFQEGGAKSPIYTTDKSKVKAYKDSLNLYNKGEKNFKEYQKLNKKLGIPTSSTRKWNDPVEYTKDIELSKIQPIEGYGYWYTHNPNVVTGTNIPSDLINNLNFRYKQPTQPYILSREQEQVNYLNSNNIQQLPSQYTPSNPEYLYGEEMIPYINRVNNGQYPGGWEERGMRMEKIKYQKGGVKFPIYTTDKSKVQAYNDSLNIHNSTKGMINDLKRYENTYVGDELGKQWLKYANNWYDKNEKSAAQSFKRLTKLNKTSPSASKYYSKKDNNQVAVEYKQPIQPYIYQNRPQEQVNYLTPNGIQEQPGQGVYPAPELLHGPQLVPYTRGTVQYPGGYQEKGYELVDKIYKEGGSPKLINVMDGYMPRQDVDNTATPITPKTSGISQKQLNNQLYALRTEGLRKREEEKREIESRRQAENVINSGKGKFTLPTGETKDYSKMNFREKSYVKGEALKNRGRAFPDENSIVDDLNPLNWIGSMAGNMSQAPYVAQQTDSYIPYVTAIAEPLIMGRAIGSGSINPFGKKMWTNSVSDAEFANSLLNPVPGLTTKKLINNFQNKLGNNNFNLEKLRNIYHNGKRILTWEERNFLHKQGVGSRKNYSINESAPSSITREQTEAILKQPVIPSPEGGFGGLTREETEALWRTLQQDPNWNLSSNRTSWDSPFSTSYKPKSVNISGLTKEQVLQQASNKDKDVISKMSETEFENTVVKPNGEVVPYYKNFSESQFIDEQNIIPLERKEYVNRFNSKLDLLNEIIAQKNKSGVEYKVKGLNEYGTLTFYTPEQTIPIQLTDKQKANLDWFNRDPKDWLINNAGLKQEGNVWKTADKAGDEVFNSIEEAIEFVKNNIKLYLEPKIISGESTWSTGLNPGQWKGNVEDIANKEYLRSIPGLEMSNTTSGVFPEGSGLKGTPGTKAYESINEYLKLLDLGRVKPGFNSQTQTIKDASGKIIQTGSKDVWENFINSGRAVGFYGNPKTIYGTMKTLIPAGAAGLGLKAISQSKKETPEYQKGGFVDPEIIEARKKAYRTIKPSSYDDLNNIARWYSNTAREDYDEPRSEDAWAFYLKQKEKSDYLTPSKYKPSISKDPAAKYYNVDPELEQAIFNSFKDKVSLNKIMPVDEFDLNVRYTEEELEGIPHTNVGLKDRNATGSKARMLGRFSVSKGHDEKGDYLSYYDTYDFPEIIQNRVKGEPFNIYGRVYYPNNKKQDGGPIVDLRSQQKYPNQVSDNTQNTQLNFIPKSVEEYNRLNPNQKELEFLQNHPLQKFVPVKTPSSYYEEKEIERKKEIFKQKQYEKEGRNKEGEYKVLRKPRPELDRWLNQVGYPAFELATLVEGAGEGYQLLKATGLLKSAGKASLKALSKLPFNDIPVLNQTSKINPWKFKENPNAYYRQSFSPNENPLVTKSMLKNNDPKGVNAFISAAEENFIDGTNTPFELLRLPTTESLPFFNKGKVYFGKKYTKNIKKPELLIETNKGFKDYEDFYPAATNYMSVNPDQIKQALEMSGDIRVLNPFSKQGHNLDNYNFYEPNWLQGYIQIKAPKYQKGGPIVDPRGQWKYPGQVTRIPSSNITMQGVDYPVYGVDNNGQEQMMYPGQEYNFPGADYVDEYPMMQKGGSIPVIEDAGSFNEEGIWVPNWEAMTTQAKKLGSKTIKTKNGTVIYFDNNWNVKSVNDNPVMKDGGLLSKSVTCSNCGWSWKGVEGGLDALTCHKCGGMIKMQNGGGSTEKSNSFIRTVKKYENQLMNQYINPVKNRALQRADKAGINTGIHNGPLDAIRHASSAAAMSSVIPRWANFIPGVAVANVGLTNLAGIAHEVMSPNSMKEHGSDLYNNFVGSVIGVLPVSEETKHDLILKAYENGILSNIDNNMSVSQKSTLPLLVNQKPAILKKNKNGGQHGGLDRWFAEKWVDVKTGKECGRQEGENREGYPACRPSKRINADTPKTVSELSSAEKAKFKQEKTSSERINYNHKKQMGGDIPYDTMENFYEMKEGGNVPTNPSLWSRAKSVAKSKYDVYPSAYANGFAAKWYKERGGGWRKAEYGMEVMGNGGIPTNPGFVALPEYVQQNIINNMATGGQKMPPELAYARFAAAGNLNQLGKYGYQDGGERLPNDFNKFQKFNKTLPDNLRNDNFKYGDYSHYDLYGMWDASGKPKSFDDVKDTEQFGLQEDGTYHGFSVGNDGVWLKPKSHPSAFMEYMQSQLSTDPYFKDNHVIQREDGRLQYVPITKYNNGGGIPERYKNMGFTKVGAKKQSTRPGKKWMVLAKKGDDYKVVHGGYKGMQDFKQHHSEQRRKNFWNRMGGKNSSKATDPFSPLYWHKRFGTWENGGQVNQMQNGGIMMRDLQYPVYGIDRDLFNSRLQNGGNINWLDNIN